MHLEAAAIAQEIASAPEPPAYQYPPVELLKEGSGQTHDGTEEMRQNAERLGDTLKSFGIKATIINVTRGPSITRYELELDRGPQFKRISGSLLIRGFSFLHTFHIPSYTPRDPEQMEHYVRCVREWADYVERHAAPRLLEVYGPTPDWVVYPD